MSFSGVALAHFSHPKKAVKMKEREAVSWVALLSRWVSKKKCLLVGFTSPEHCHISAVSFSGL